MWALQYWLYMERRLVVEDAEAALEAHCSVMWPERWKQVYGNRGGDMGEAFDGEEELPVTDISELDRWYAGLDERRVMTGAEADRHMNELAVLGFAEGKGRRV